MKKTKKLLSIIAVILMILCMTIPVSAAGKINRSRATLLSRQTLQLEVLGTNSTTKWASSKKSVATVSNSGKVKAKKAGSATITAKVGKKKYSCKLTVESPKLNKKALSLTVGGTGTLKVTGTKQTVKWKSSRKGIATVNNGIITAKKAGTANIIATVLGKNFVCKVTVKNISAPNNTNPETPATEGEVWIPNSGSKYHKSSDCSNMKNPKQVTLDQAISMGYTPCKKCY